MKNTDGIDEYNYVRHCLICREPLLKPLRVGGKPFKFCCLKHRAEWELLDSRERRLLLIKVNEKEKVNEDSYR